MKNLINSTVNLKRLIKQIFVISYLPPANEVWGKVIFLHLFVILLTGGEYLGRYPPDQVHPQQVHPPDQVPPRARYTPLGRYTPWAGTPPDQVHPPPQTATVADGTHPTRVHFCFDQIFLFQWSAKKINFWTCPLVT